jgi:hypothetical protein
VDLFTPSRTRTVKRLYRTLSIRVRLPASTVRYVEGSRPFVERGSSGLPFAHNKSRGSKRCRAAFGDITGLYERNDGGGEGQHRKQCWRSPHTGERERCVAEARRTAPSSIRSWCIRAELPVRNGEATTTGILRNKTLSRQRQHRQWAQSEFHCWRQERDLASAGAAGK